MTSKKHPSDNKVSVLLVGGFGHAVWVFDEWLDDDAPVRLVGAVQVLEDEHLDNFLAHPWAQKFNPSRYQDLDQALSIEKPDLVIVSTRPDSNPDIIEHCLRSGCHVIAEKPLGVDQLGLLRLHKAAKETGKHILPMLGMNKSPAFIEARDMIKEGLIGEPVLINARKSYQWGKRADWFDQRDTYAGIWGWVGIHSFHHAAYLLDCNAVRVLAAQEQNRFHPQTSSCSDSLTGLFLLENNIQMTVSIDLLRPDGQKEWGDDWVRVVGSMGSLEVNSALGTIRLIRKGHEEEVRTTTSTRQVPYYTAFLEAITSDADFSDLTSLGLQLSDSALCANHASFDNLNNIMIHPKNWSMKK
jgi:predicted dehydrogenase